MEDGVNKEGGLDEEGNISGYARGCAHAGSGAGCLGAESLSHTQPRAAPWCRWDASRVSYRVARSSAAAWWGHFDLRDFAQEVAPIIVSNERKGPGALRPSGRERRSGTGYLSHLTPFA